MAILKGDVKNVDSIYYISDSSTDDLASKTSVHRFADRFETAAYVIADLIILTAVYYALMTLLGLPLRGILIVPIYLLAIHAHDLYEPKLTLSVLDRFPSAIAALTISAMISLAVSVFFPSSGLTPLSVIMVWLFLIIMFPIGRTVTNFMLTLLRSRGRLTRKALIVGAGEIGTLIARKIMRRKSLGLEIIGLVDKNPPASFMNSDLEVQLFSSENKIDGLVREFSIDRLIITFSSYSTKRSLEAIRSASKLPVRILVVPRMFEILGSEPIFDSIEGIPLMELNRVRLKSFNLIIKRVIDIILSSILLLILWIPGLLVALVIKMDSNGPVLFVQKRVGRNGEIVKVYKFRSMRENAEQEQEQFENMSELQGPLFSLRNDPRVTRIGRLIRISSIDELPQLINVLIGNMSLVGPRPQPIREVQQYESWQHRRLLVKPGITGPWQVTGRNELSFDEMVMLDLKYIQNWSLMLDIKLLLQTIPAVLSRRGAY